MFGSSSRFSIPPRLVNPLVNSPVRALLINGPTIVANGANGPSTGARAVPNAVKSPEITEDTDEVACGAVVVTVGGAVVVGGATVVDATD